MPPSCIAPWDLVHSRQALTARQHRTRVSRLWSRQCLRVLCPCEPECTAFTCDTEVPSLVLEPDCIVAPGEQDAVADVCTEPMEIQILVVRIHRPLQRHPSAPVCYVHLLPQRHHCASTTHPRTPSVSSGVQQGSVLGELCTHRYITGVRCLHAFVGGVCVAPIVVACTRCYYGCAYECWIFWFTQ